MSSQLLDWPSGFDRTPEGERRPGSKFSTNYRRTKKDIRREMERLEVESWRLDDVSGSSGDPGVVLRWTKHGDEFVVACDAYVSKRANGRAALLWIRETRKRSDRPVQTGQDEFAAARLPPGDADAVTVAPEKPPHEVLGVRPDAREEVVDAAFRAEVKEAHSDHGGDGSGVQALKDARDRMLSDQSNQ